MSHHGVERPALIELGDDLLAAQEQMGLNSRGGAITALQAMIQFVNSFPDWEAKNMSLPLTMLLSALDDLDSGRVVKMLTPKEAIDNRKPDAGVRKVQRAASIFCIEQLRGLGVRSEDACKFVADVLEKAGVAIGGRRDTPPWRTVRSWQYDTTKRPVEDQESHTLSAFRRDFGLPEGISVEEAKRRIRRDLTLMVSIFSLGLG
jgi:hypothetical protein